MTLTNYCPICGYEADDTTLADHGCCIYCHKQMLNGERCRFCFALDHDSDDCPYNLCTEKGDHP